MKHLTILICGLCIGLIAHAQIAFETIGNQQTLRINANGLLAINPSDLSASFNQKETNNHFLNQAGLWIMAEDNNQNLLTSVHYMSGTDSFDFWSGPVDTLTGIAANTEDWNKLWKISKSEIDFHRTHYSDENYEVPSSIIEWPGQNGNNPNFLQHLAPFVDANNNQVYDPENGDYPYIKGNEAVYCIFNDVAAEHTASLGAEINLEVHLMAFTPDATSSAIFLEYFVISRNSSDLSNVKIGFFMGGECGNASDNFAGTIAANPASSKAQVGSIYLHNGDDDDEGAFGIQLPFVAAHFLNHNLDNSIVFSGTNDSTGNPKSNQDYIQYLSGEWLDGKPLTKNNQGRDQGTKYPFIYHIDANDTTNTWTESEVLNTPGKRNILGVANYGNMSQNDFIKFDIALTASLYSNTQKITSVVVQSQTVKDELKTISSIADPEILQDLEIIPNPSYGSFIISYKTPLNGRLLITDYKGSTVFEKIIHGNSVYPCNLSLHSGIYHLTVQEKDRILHKTILITN